MSAQGQNHFSQSKLLFQLLLYALVFVFDSVDHHHPQIDMVEFIFFLNPALVALVTSLVLLPRFFYRKRYLGFAMGVVGLIAAAMIVEELVLEQIYYPDTRGAHFMGVFYTMMGLLPIITILVGISFAWDALSKQREVEALQAAVRESELQFLKSQINPHFLFNNLNNLYAFALEQSPKTPEIILELSSVLRYMLYDCREKVVPLSREIEQLRNYAGISELQIGERGRVHFEAVPAAEDLKIAPLLLVVFIENAFKHSLASQSKDIELDIRLAVDAAGRLRFNCINTYQDRSNVDQLTAGIGLENVRKRLQWLYGDAHTLTIDRSDGKFYVQLTLDLTRSPQS